ncbi:hypothetical protein O3P69_005686 [Scylla paramamosain]|uniref:Uncharacterized protein n=1 Tax=Scylla paramamosain TaxID=85552 RepID=A0AAW0U8R5_SCYPA
MYLWKPCLVHVGHLREENHASHGHSRERSTMARRLVGTVLLVGVCLALVEGVKDTGVTKARVETCTA